MKIVAIDTATPASSVALLDGREVLATTSRVDRRGHGAFLVPALDFCFDQVAWRPEDLDAVVVDVGPGLYTGIRVGIATAQGLAAAVGIPVVGASSLDAIALRAATGRRHIWVVVDVRRGEFAVAGYRPVPGGVLRDGAPQLVSADHFKALIESDPDDVLVVGDVSELPDGTLRGAHRAKTARPRYPSAEALAEAAAASLMKADPSEDVRPFYMREPDVNINWDLLRSEGPWASEA